MKKRSVMIAALCAALLLVGCGSKESSSSYDRSYEAADTAVAEADYYDGGSDFSSGYSDDYDYDYAAEDMEYEEADYDDSSAGSTTKEVTEENVEEYGTKIIRNASISLDVGSLEEFSDNLKKTVYDYGGYMESMDINAYDSDYSESRYGYYTARIPAAKLDDFLNIVKDEGTVTAKSESAEDVTLQYVDVEARIATYEAERDSLMELLDKATTLKDILTIRDKIAEVNYELDSLQRQLKSMQNKVSYSTVSISAKETRTIAGSKGEKSFFTKIGENFASEMEDGLEIAIDLIIFIITRLPLFAILALIVFAIVKVVTAIFGKSGKEKKAAKKQAVRQTGKQATASGQPAPASGQPVPAESQPVPAEGQPLPEETREQNEAPAPAQAGGHFTSNVPPVQGGGDGAGKEEQ
ncbi:MAG: DUF4349 domain-containing protein [Lachnospiraceae bacterium]|nr:DUF4349 domain-containing protein [Lachnospiraceae bacterium]